jgi:hypothetical protein
MVTKEIPYLFFNVNFLVYVSSSKKNRHIGELCPNGPECSVPIQKIDIDNNARIRYHITLAFGAL